MPFADASPRTPPGKPGASARLAAMCDAAALVLLGLFLVFVLCTFRDYGITIDEWVNQESGELTLKLYTSFGADQRAVNFLDLYYYGPWYQTIVAVADRFLPYSAFDTRHLMGGLAGVATALASWYLGRQTLGAAGGLLTLILLLATGYFVGNVFNDPIDTPFMLAMTLSLVAINRYLGRMDESGWRLTLPVGLAIGLALATRIGGVLFLVNLAVGQAIFSLCAVRRAGWRSATPTIGRFVVDNLLIGLVALAVTYALWPWLWPDPIARLLAAADHFSHMPLDFEFPFFGRTFRTTMLPAWYVPANLLVRLPEAFLLCLFVLPVALIAAGGAVVRASERLPLLMRLNVGLGWVLPIAVVIVTRPILYDGFRHLLFILPPLAVTAAWGGLLVLQHWRWLGIALAAVVLVGLTTTVSTLIRLHPYEYVYFNRLVGGPAGAAGQFELDYWGASLREAAHVLVARLTAERGADAVNEPVSVDVCNPWHDSAQLLPPAWRGVDVGEDKIPDFAITFERKYCPQYDQYPIYAVVSRLGVVLATVYDLRHGPMTP